MEIDELSEKVRAELTKAASRSRNLTRFIKIVFVAIGSAIVAVAQFVEADPAAFTIWQVVGIAFSLIVAAGAIFLAFLEEDSTDRLLLAQRAVDRARAIERFLDDFEEYEYMLEQVVAALSSSMFMRTQLELAAVDSRNSVDDLIEIVVRSCERNLPVAFGFSQKDIWTISVYRADADQSGAVELRCVSHNRAIKSDVENVRVWSEGVGVAGICFANGREIVVPDLMSKELGSTFKNGQQEKVYDAERYRSIVAVPVEVEGLERPWGVIVVTTDQPEHFDPADNDGFQNAEPARVLSGMVALAVAIATPKTQGAV